ncbi:hypothetical protein A4F89_05540 [Polynucleobacter asymbioticus]|jgi:hypothetical protein|uniref:Uncharacterized protein n=1 Tax=Polynucleobacter asymbioticus TaxID=576611 RepID=A0AAC9ISM9_9BURK|nr:hypothetical protein A4F89_05540 [Polynucleobacter asymbioticus]APC01130.1 hypothetical protein AOC25_05635 [Polynucleobacter asymbioticus]
MDFGKPLADVAIGHRDTSLGRDSPAQAALPILIKCNSWLLLPMPHQGAVAAPHETDGFQSFRYKCSFGKLIAQEGGSPSRELPISQHNRRFSLFFTLSK